jgi:uncharacterized protein YndB with AHSA1/START domain
LHFRHAELSPVREPIPEQYRDYEHGARVTGEVTRWEPPHVLAHTWSEPSGEFSEVTYELSPRGEDVLLVLTHRRLHGRDTLISVASGWHTHLGILEDRLHDREPDPFWSRHAQLEAEYKSRLT